MNIQELGRSYYQQFQTLPSVTRISLLIIVTSLFIQLFFLLPLATSNSEKVETLASKKEDIQWIKERLPRLLNQKTTTVKSSSSLLGSIEASFNALPGKDKKLSEDSQSSVVFDMKILPFDSLMTWLITLDKQGISLTKATVTAIDKEPGKVNVRGYLSK